MHFNKLFNMCEECISDTLCEREDVLFQNKHSMLVL